MRRKAACVYWLCVCVSVLECHFHALCKHCTSHSSHRWCTRFRRSVRTLLLLCGFFFFCCVLFVLMRRLIIRTVVCWRCCNATAITFEKQNGGWIFFLLSKKREIATNKFKAPNKKRRMQAKWFLYGRHSAEGSRQRNFFFNFVIFREQRLSRSNGSGEKLHFISNKSHAN